MGATEMAHGVDVVTCLMRDKSTDEATHVDFIPCVTQRR